MSTILLTIIAVLGLVGFGTFGASLLMRDRSEERDFIGPLIVVAGIVLLVAAGDVDSLPFSAIIPVGGLAAIVGGLLWSGRHRRLLRRARKEERRELEASGVPEGAMELLRLEDRLDEVRIRAPHLGGFGLTLVVAVPFVGLAAMMGGVGPWVVAAITGSVPAAAGYGLWKRWREGLRISARIEALLESGADPPPPPGGPGPAGADDAPPTSEGDAGPSDPPGESPPGEPPTRR